MSGRVEMVSEFYGKYEENSRLSRSRHGQLEYFTTMNYIHRYLQKSSRVIEIGAGTGRYSIALAKEGIDVTAVELVQHNLDILRTEGAGIDNLVSFQGDATNLNGIDDDTFDVTLMLGPMYHLYEESDVDKAINEAVRITRPGGVLLVAFLPIYAVFNVEYLNENFREGMEMNFTEDFRVKHFQEQMFTGYDINEFEQLFNGKNVTELTIVSTDNVLQFVEQMNGFSMTDEDFELFCKFHLATCEKRELLGNTNHALYICRKDG